LPIDYVQTRLVIS